MSKAIAELHPWLEPQERFDRILATTFRRFGNKVVDLSYANFYDGPPKPVLVALEKAVADGGVLALQYTPYGGRTVTRRLIAASLAHEFGLPFDHHSVILTPGATAALNMIFRTLFGPETEVILPTPCWHDYPLYLTNLGIPIRAVPLGPDKHLDVEAIAQALGPRTGGILFSQPCCPTGVVYSKTELEELSGLLKNAQERFQTAIYLISDEVHRHSVWGEKAFDSPLATYPRGLTIYSFGKALSIQGQKIGYVAVSPEMPENKSIVKQLEQCERMMGFGAPTTLMQHAVCDLIDYRPPLDLIAERQRQARRELQRFGYEVCDAGATYFMYVRCPIPNDFAFAEHLAARGVLVLPSTLFHEPGYVRISLTARADAIAMGLRVLGEVLHDL
jgi:aspartate aminotransferase